MQYGLKTLLSVCAGATALVTWAGNYHFLHGSQAPSSMIAKVSWSLSETIINTDTALGIPPYEAMSRYPLLLQAFQRDIEAARKISRD